MSSERVLVIGCGVSGLSSAIRLLEAGFSVEIVSKAFPPQTTSDKAAAVWYPYRASPQDRVLEWGRRTLQAFLPLSRLPDTGVSLIPLWEVFETCVDDPWWRSAVPDFRRLAPSEVPRGYRDGYAVTVPLMETPRYMPYLLDRVRHLGGTIHRQATEIGTFSDCDRTWGLVVNCTGLGSATLCGDSRLVALRGQVVTTHNPGIGRGIVDGTGSRALAYIIPRSGDCVLGGTDERGVWDEEVSASTSRDILERCRGLDPRLGGQRILTASVGLRPGRDEVRLEIEDRSDGCPVIHNYGHGGAGFTLSWGCADEVVELALKARRE